MKRSRSNVLTTDSEMVMLANELHPLKAPSSMVVTESGIVMLANELHPEKALCPMVVTESGMVTVFTPCLSTPHSSHESSPSLSQEGRHTIVVVPSGMLKCPSTLMTCAAIVICTSTSVSGRQGARSAGILKVALR